MLHDVLRMNYEGAMNETRKMCFLMKQVSHDGEVSLLFIRPPAVRVPPFTVNYFVVGQKADCSQTKSSRSWNDY